MRKTAQALTAALLLCVTTAAQSGGAPVATGLGRYYDGPKSGGDVQPPLAPYRTAEMAARAVATNQWYSSVAYKQWSQPLHAHPVTYQATPQGFELGVPQRTIGSFGGSREIRYPHAAAITVQPLGFQPADARLAGASDWLVRVRMADAASQSLDATVLHGSPFSYFECSAGDVRLQLAGTVQRLEVADGRVAAFRVGTQSYAAFAPTGGRWEWVQDTQLVLHLPATARYFSIAALPNGDAATVEAFLAVAYAFPVDTKVEWAFDERTSQVRATYRVQAAAREGTATTTFMGLYPHQWKALNPAPAAPYSYDSIRGPIRLVTGNEFTVTRTFNGFTPSWGAVQSPAERESVESLLVGDRAKVDSLYTRMGRGTYWYGKGLGATAQLLGIAESHGKTDARDDLLARLKQRLQAWFSGERSSYFYHDARTGTFVGLPQEYDSVLHMNDHHFHYGYWILSAAQVALRDPAWAGQDQWGGMVGKIIADIATPERGRADFPFLRNFDPYEGHSWASGDADFDAGNNQESSSEAVNAWAGLILWGEATGDRAMRDLGVYLYTSEIASIEQYWFNLDRDIYPAEYGQPFASMVFGGKVAYNTWWTQEPRQIFGINLLPLTTASTYLGRDPAYLPALAARLPGEVKAYESRGLTDGTPPDIWQDVIAASVALGDPAAGKALWRRNGSVEMGETRTHVQHWLARLGEMGPPDFSVTADTTLYAVFRRADGTRTHLAYNAGSSPRRVTFSDGQVLEVAPRSLAQSR
jgi:endoglucanase Acf2